MLSMLVTCPESAHLEEIELDIHPCGILIRRCSALDRQCGDCPRTCAARLDRRLATRSKPLGAILLARSCWR
jgi:hypothetical protein